MSDSENGYFVPILPYGMSTQNAVADTAYLFFIVMILIIVIMCFKVSIDNACNSSLLMGAVAAYFVYSVSKHWMVEFSYDIEKKPVE